MPPITNRPRTPARTLSLLGSLVLSLVLTALPRAEAVEPGPVPVVVRGQIAGRIDRLMSRAAVLGYGGQVLAEMHGEVILHKAYGFADRARRVPMRVDTRLGIASISKQFTAAAILRLRDDGRLALDDAVGRYVPELSGPVADLKLRDLLSHASGLAGGDAGGDFEITSHQDLLRRIVDRGLWAAPRERWIYANSGYSLLATVVENVSGEPYEEYVVRELFAGAGMEHSGFWHWPPVREGQVAHAYMAWRDEGSPAEWERNWRVYGAGDVLSTAADLYRWERTLRAGTVIDRKSADEAFSAQMPIEGGGAYGYAAFVYKDARGENVVDHGGDWQRGYNGVVFRYLDRDALVILTSNSRDQGEMWMRQSVQAEIDRLVHGEEPKFLPPAVEPVPEALRETIAGSYALPESRIVVFDDGTYPWIGAVGQGAVDLLAGYDDADRAATARGGERTKALLAATDRPEEAFAAAIGEEGARYLPDYLQEWEGLIGDNGPLVDYTVLGTIRRRDAVVTHTRLTFENGVREMRFNWSELGNGRLVGTFVVPPWLPADIALGYPLAARPDGRGLVGYELFRELGVGVEPTDGGLRITGASGTAVEAVRAGELPEWIASDLPGGRSP